MENLRNVFFVIGLFLWSGFCQAAPGAFSYQGQIVKPNGQPLEGASVTFTLQVLSPGSEECLLYEEVQVINMSNSNGIFAFNIGEGSRSGSDYEDVTSLATALSNTTGTVTPTNCSSGPSYTPSATDGRLLRVTFDDGSGPTTLSQDHRLVSVPYAQSAATVDGISSSELLRVNTGGSNVLTQANLENIFDSTNHTELLALIGGTSTQYLQGVPSADFSMNSNQITDLAAPTLGTDAANKGYVDGNLGQSSLADLSALGAGETGQVLTWNGSQWVSQTASGDATKLPLDGSSAMAGNLNMGGNDITNTNDIDVGNDLTVTNNATVTGSLSANGLSSSGTLALYNGANYVGFQAPAGASDLIWTLPGSDGSNGQFLTTDGSGVLSWTTSTAPVTSVFGRTGVVVAQTSDYTANQVDNTAAGNIAATDVQAALNELDSEKLAKSGDNMTGHLTMDTNREIRFGDADDSHYVGFRAPSNITAAGSFVWSLPVDDGSAGDVLITDGSGQLSFTANNVAGKALSNQNIWVGNGSNQAAEVVMSGDATLSNTGALSLSANSVDTAEIVNDAVTTVKIVDDAVTTAKIVDDAVTTAKVVDDAITTVKIVDDAVTTPKVVDNAITSAKINDGEIVDADINASAAIAATKIAGGGVDNTEFGYLDGVTSAIQTQLDNKLESSDITGKATLGGDNGAVVLGSNDNTLSLEANNSTAVTIDASGNVGVGTTNPRTELGSSMGTNPRYLTIRSNGATDGSPAIIGLSNPIATPTASSSAGSIQGVLSSQGTTPNSRRIAIIGMRADGSTAGSYGGAIHFSVKPDNDNITGPTEAMTIVNSGNIGVGTTTPDTILEIAGTLKVADGSETCSAGTDGGMIRYSGTDLQYCNGTAWQTLGLASSGVTSFNGETGSTQTLAIGSSGNAPAWSSATNTHTLNIPLASSSGTVTSGTISNADYVSFNSKLDAVAGETLASTNIWVGNGSNQAAAVAVSGDATLANTGALSLSANSVDTAEIVDDAVTTAKIVDDAVTTAKVVDNAITSTKINDGEIVDADINASAAIAATKIAGGGVDNTEFGYLDGVTSAIQTQLDNKLEASDITGKATLGGDNGAVVLGSNDSTLSLEANNSTAMTILSSGNVGIGTTTPDTILEIAGTLKVADGSETCSAGTDGGMIRYSGTDLQYCNGTAWQTLGLASSGVTSFNGETGSTQTLAIGSSGNAPAWSSATNTHTLNIPLASSSGTVTSGTISNADYVSFNSKLDAVAGETLASTNIWVGNGSNQAAAVAVSGDATLANTGALSLSANSVDTAEIVDDAVTTAKIVDDAVTTAKVVDDAITTAKIVDNAITSAKINDGEIVDADINASAAIAATKIAGGGVDNTEFGYLDGVTSAIQTQLDNKLEASDITGKATLGGDSGAVVLGSNDSTLSLEANNSTAVTIDASGNVGVGTTAPQGTLDISSGGSPGLSIGGDDGSNTRTDATAKKARIAMPHYTNAEEQAALIFGNSTSTHNNVNIGGGTNNHNAATRIRFFTASDQTTLLGTEQMIITSSGNVGIGTTTPDTILEIAGTLKVADGSETCSAGADGGMIRYSGTDLQYCNGTAWQTLGLASSGVTSFNGETGSTQTLAIGSSGNAPVWSSGTNTHTLNIPLASSSGTVTSGTISNADYVSFGNKLDAVAGETLASTNIWVGNGSNQAAAVAISGDATLANDGTLSLAANSVDTTEIVDDAVTTAKIVDDAVTTTKVVDDAITTAKIVDDAITTAKIVDNAITSAKINDGEIVDADINASAAIAATKIAGGGVDNTEFGYIDGVTSAIQTQLDSKLESGDITGKATLGGDSGAVVLGSNDSTLSLEANNSTAVTIDTSGNVGIGTTSMSTSLNVTGSGVLVNKVTTVGNTAPSSLILMTTNSSGAAADNNGTSIAMMAETETDGTVELVSQITATAIDATAGTVDGRLRFFNAIDGTPTEVVTIDGGYFGIGTTSPNTELHVDGAVTINGAIKNVSGSDLVLPSGRHFSTAGTAGSPGYSFVTDDDTGIFRAALNSLGFTTGGTERVRINSSGEVGIGTTTPAATLDVTGVDAIIVPQGTLAQRPSTPENGMIRYNSTSTKMEAYENGSWVDLAGGGGGGGYTDGDTILAAAGSASAPGLSFDTDTDTGFRLLAGGQIRLVSGGTDAFYFNANGLGAVSGGVYIRNSGASVTNPMFTTPGDLNTGLNLPGSDVATLTTGGSERVRINSSGDVGIGTNSPAARLHVDGSGAGGGLCVTSDGTCGSVPAGGEISAETTLNTGADYAEYFEAEEELLSGDLVGLNRDTGKVRGYRSGDLLLGIVSTDPGVIGNSELANQEDTVLVALVGQVPFNSTQVTIQNGRVYSLDQVPVGYLLSNGNAYINLSSSGQSPELKKNMDRQNQSLDKQAREISSLKQENKQLKEQQQKLFDENTQLKKLQQEILMRLQSLEQGRRDK